MNYLYICDYYVIILPFKGAVIINKVFVFVCVWVSGCNTIFVRSSARKCLKMPKGLSETVNLRRILKKKCIG